MSPSAVALAVLLHVMVVALLWWLSQDRFHVTPTEEPIQVTFEQPKPPDPPPPPPPQPQPAVQQPPPPPPPLVEALRPPAEMLSDKPTQVPPSEVSKAPPAPPPPPEQKTPPLQAEPPLPPEPPAKAEAPQKPEPQAAKPPDLSKPPEPQRPQEQALAAPRPPPPPTPKAPAPDLKPSPLATRPQTRPPAAPAPVDPPSAHRFVNPADSYNRARASDNYLWQVARRLSGYRYQAKTNANEGLTVVRVTIARDGRLLDASIARSSGVPEFDQGVLAGVRSGSPYTPLPPEIPGDRATFNLPLVSSRR